MANSIKYMAIDFGAKRIGLAVSDAGGRLAFAHSTLERVGNKRDSAAIIALVRGLGIGGLVFGLPRALDEGAEPSESERRARSFGSALEAALRAAGLDLPVVWWDERFSTREALAGMHAAGISERSGRDGVESRGVDARAAAVILQGFLDSLIKETDSQEL